MVIASYTEMLRFAKRSKMQADILEEKKELERIVEESVQDSIYTPKNNWVHEYTTWSPNEKDDGGTGVPL
jgi:hypothetical protein